MIDPHRNNNESVFLQLVSQLAAADLAGYWVCDEAHLIHEWYRSEFNFLQSTYTYENRPTADFRTDFRNIGLARNYYKAPFLVPAPCDIYL